MKRYLLVLLLLAACAKQGYWIKADGYTYNAQDASECEFEAVKATAAVQGDIAIGFKHVQIYNACMISRGYHQQAY